MGYMSRLKKFNNNMNIKVPGIKGVGQRGKTYGNELVDEYGYPMWAQIRSHYKRVNNRESRSDRERKNQITAAQKYRKLQENINSYNSNNKKSKKERKSFKKSIKKGRSRIQYLNYINDLCHEGYGSLGECSNKTNNCRTMVNRGSHKFVYCDPPKPNGKCKTGFIDCRKGPLRLNNNNNNNARLLVP